MIDKNYCASSYLAFRFIENDKMDFFEGLNHKKFSLPPVESRVSVINYKEIGKHIESIVQKYRNKKIGLFLSGGMDSAIVASYLTGFDAYTFRFNEVDTGLTENSRFSGELERAEYYAQKNNMNLHYVDIDWNTVEEYLDDILKNKGQPIHSIEVQLYKAALQAKSDGVEVLFTGATSDLIFGGMDHLLSKDWDFDAFKTRYMFVDPEQVLKDSVDMSDVFERYRLGNNIDFVKFLSEVSLTELSTSYNTIFDYADIDYCDPYSDLIMKETFDLNRIRKGESKYLIRQLMKERYPEFEVPNKIPMPRPVDVWFEDWEGPKRAEFKDDLDISSFTGNQKWQLFCLERFLSIFN